VDLVSHCIFMLILFIMNVRLRLDLIQIFRLAD